MGILDKMKGIFGGGEEEMPKAEISPEEVTPAEEKFEKAEAVEPNREELLAQKKAKLETLVKDPKEGDEVWMQEVDTLRNEIAELEAGKPAEAAPEAPAEAAEEVAAEEKAA